MAWDIQLESVTSDLVFSSASDIAGVSGEEIFRQRISIRCKIPRGTYLYDETGTLGSNLHLVPRSPSLAQMQEARAAVIEALSPMSDEITVIDVTAEKTEENTLQVNVNFQPVLNDPDIPIYDTEIDSISVTIPQE